jgi:hypothetical protein
MPFILTAVIAAYDPDTAAIRRHMIEYEILEQDGEIFIGLGSTFYLVTQGRKSPVRS